MPGEVQLACVGLVPRKCPVVLAPSSTAEVSALWRHFARPEESFHLTRRSCLARCGFFGLPVAAMASPVWRPIRCAAFCPCVARVSQSARHTGGASLYRRALTPIERTSMNARDSVKSQSGPHQSPSESGFWIQPARVFQTASAVRNRPSQPLGISMSMTTVLRVYYQFRFSGPSPQKRACSSPYI
jgi:hypothetical protein